MVHLFEPATELGRAGEAIDVDGDVEEEATDDERTLIRSRAPNKKRKKQTTMAIVAVNRHLLFCRCGYPANSVSFEMDMVDGGECGWCERHTSEQ
jgi:hypothetical protein